MSNVSLGFSASLLFGVPIGRFDAAAFDWKVIFWGIRLFTLLGIFAVAKAIPSMKGERIRPSWQTTCPLEKSEDRYCARRDILRVYRLFGS